MTPSWLIQSLLLLASVVLSLVFVLEALIPPFEAAVGYRVLVALGAVAKIFFQGLGLFVSLGNAADFPTESADRRAWASMGGAFFMLLLGQLSLAPGQILGIRPHPLPLLPDLFFLASYVFLVLALVSFGRAYEQGGWWTGGVAARAVILALVLIVEGSLLVPLLRPLIADEVSLLGRAIVVAYGLGDILVLALAVVLAGATVRHGKRMRRVWGGLLAGMAVLAVGDMFSAYLSAGQWPALEPLIDTFFVFAYGLLAVATVAQRGLLEGEP